MTQKQAIQLFEERKVRTVWDDEAGKWYVSIVDVIAVLTESKDAAAYWRKLKRRLETEGNEPETNCHGLKIPAPDGKMRLTDVADVEQLFRLVQSIPSPKAEPFKQLLLCRNNNFYPDKQIIPIIFHCNKEASELQRLLSL